MQKCNNGQTYNYNKSPCKMDIAPRNPMQEPALEQILMHI